MALSFYVGNDVSIPVNFKDKAGAAIDITDYRLWFSIVDSATARYEDAIISQSLGEGMDVAHVDPMHGNTIIHIDKEATADLHPGVYLFRVDIANPGGAVLTPVTGQIAIYNYDAQAHASGGQFNVTIAENTATLSVVIVNTQITGTIGLSAYQVAVENGFNGTEPEWLISLKGATGAAGANGVDGVDGEDGAPGPNQVTTSTSTNITGLLKGSGGNVAEAEESVDYAGASHTHSGTYEPANANIQSHISNTSNPHSVTAAQVGALTTSSTITDFISGLIAAPVDGDYVILRQAPIAGTITSITTKCASGTCTLTGYVNTTALGGTANSVSSSEQEQAHASSNTFSAGDDIKLTVSSNSSCVGLEFTIKYTRALS